MSANAMENLITEFGSAIGIPNLQLDEEKRCNLMFDEIAVSFELSKSEESIYMYSYLDTAPTTNAEKIYAILLDANYIFKHTNGATLGVEASSKKIVLIREEQLALMRLAQFESITEEFVNLAEYWKQRLATFASESHEDESVDESQTIATHAMKV